ncbi:unnamed protein product [Amoebophrya sp. A25]|nr:unnamed protein product [Amoebophrya sp. A25]|eukprot:GSA25T00001107001.1
MHLGMTTHFPSIGFKKTVKANGQAFALKRCAKEDDVCATDFMFVQHFVFRVVVSVLLIVGTLTFEFVIFPGKPKHYAAAFKVTSVNPARMNDFLAQKGLLRTTPIGTILIWIVGDLRFHLPAASGSKEQEEFSLRKQTWPHPLEEMIFSSDEWATLQQADKAHGIPYHEHAGTQVSSAQIFKLVKAFFGDVHGLQVRPATTPAPNPRGLGFSMSRD